MIELESLLEQVKEIVLSASSFTQVDSFSVSEKEGESWNIVTSADVAVQDFLQRELLALLSGSSFVGEENHQQDTSKELCWIVDPIDGTANFARGMRQSGISVALRAGKELVLGVVYNPDLKDLFWAAKGHGAYLNGERLSVSDKDFEHSILCTAMCLYRKGYSKVCSDILMDAYMKIADFRRFGVASLELCYLAAGRVDLYFELRLFPWDFSAGALIIREAGGVVCTMSLEEGNVHLSDELVFDAPSPVIAANCCENLHKIGGIITKYMSNFDLTEYK